MATTRSAVGGTHQVVFALLQHGEDMERGLDAEMDVIAGLATRAMQRNVAKFRSTLWESIDASAPEPLVREVRPGVDYAGVVEDGVKPGGKGLPRFLDPAAKGIVDWLQSKAFAGQGRARKNSMAAVMRNLELRDRYEGLAWHIRHKGTKAQPFVAPTAQEMEDVMRRRLDLAGRRVLAARPDAGGAVA